MSRDFNGTSEYLEYAGAVRTALPLTISAWVYKDDTTNLDVAVSLSNNASLNRCGLAFTNSAAVRNLAITSGGTNSNTDTTTLYTANTWTHGAAVYTSTTSRTVYINGGNAVNNTNSLDVSPGTFNTTNIGCYNNSAGRAQFFGGYIAEVGIWSVALTAAEIASLGVGVSPILIRPASLVAYWPIIGEFSPEIDLKGRFEMTVSGAVKAEHPRAYKPRSPIIPRKAAANVVPVLYRQRQMQGMAA